MDCKDRPVLVSRYTVLWAADLSAAWMDCKDVSIPVFSREERLTEVQCVDVLLDGSLHLPVGQPVEAQHGCTVLLA